MKDSEMRHMKFDLQKQYHEYWGNKLHNMKYDVYYFFSDVQSSLWLTKLRYKNSNITSQKHSSTINNVYATYTMFN